MKKLIQGWLLFLAPVAAVFAITIKVYGLSVVMGVLVTVLWVIIGLGCLIAGIVLISEYYEEKETS